MRSIDHDALRVTLDNHYTMDGSAIRGTMVGGALAPDVHVELATDADDAALRNLAADAIDGAPLNGFLRGENTPASSR